MEALENFSDEDFRKAILRTLRLLGILTALAAPLFAWKMGWHGAVMLLVGAAISASGLWEWLRLMTALMLRMDAGGEAKPMTWLLIGFFLRLGLTVLILYGSLKLLNGSIYALAAGLGLGIFSLTVEGLKLVKAWTV